MAAPFARGEELAQDRKMDAKTLARQMAAGIHHAIKAHTDYPKEPGNTVRYQDHLTPYFVHPIWCGMTLLTETSLDLALRVRGYQALLWHDVLEDTNLSLPTDTTPEVSRLVDEMTYGSFREEREQIWEKSDEAKLLKAYDKVSNLLDGDWMTSKKWNTHVAHTDRLLSFVSERYGELNIVRMGRAVCRPKLD
tara:strand:+ start:8 stop:586 length:579 start_codon:yes stop_codon:yes gene_type:complete